MRNNRFLNGLVIAGVLFGLVPNRGFAQQTKEDEAARREHETIGVGPQNPTDSTHTQHPDAQWYPDASFGLFIHWGIASVKSSNISWPMIPGRALAAKKIDDPAEQQRIVREQDWNLNGKPNGVTPNQYWSWAKDFNPTEYDPDKWLKAAKDAGFTYAVLTARHHEGFAPWPSKFGDFSTKNWMSGKDLIRPYVEACRKNGLKVGLYYSPPDWYFDREYMSFLYGRAKTTNPWVPSLDGDLKPRTSKHSAEDQKRHTAEYAAHVRGQIEELLTNYGKIDLIWFDGKPAGLSGDEVITQARIRELQPGILINPRLHGKGDFVTFERKLGTEKPVTGWAEFCNTWTSSWSHQEIPFRANGFVLGQLVTSHSLGVNYLLGIGPMKTGEMCDDVYKNMAVVAGWMKQNGESIRGTKVLPKGETASVPAVSSGSARYLFAIPKFEGGEYDKNLVAPGDETITLKGIRGKPSSVKLLGDGAAVDNSFNNGELSIKLPAGRRTKLVDVVKVEM